MRFWNITPDADEYRGDVARVSDAAHIGGINLEERNANARLIAEAPAMAEALDALVMACELPGDHCEVEQALPAARAILARIKGAA